MDNNFNNGFGGNPVDPSQQMNQQYQQPMQPDMNQTYQQQGVQPQYDQPQYTQQPQFNQAQYTQQPQYDQAQYTQQPQYDQTQAQPQFNQAQYTQQPQYDQAQYTQQPQFNQAQFNQQPQYDQTQAQPQYDQAQYTQQPQQPQQPQFNQPGVTPQFTQPTPPAGGKPPKTKKPMSGGKIAGLICGGLAIVAAIVCAIIFVPKLFKSDKDVVIDAFKATFEADSKSANFADDIDMPALMKKIEENGGNITGSFTIKEIAGAPSDAIGNATIKASESYDPKNKLVNLELKAVYDGKDLIGFQMIGEQDNTYFALGDLIDGYFSIPNKDIDKAIMNSAIGELLKENGVELPPISIDYFSKGGAPVDSSIYSGYVDALENLWDSVEYKKGKTVKTEVNGESIKAKEYTVTLKEEDIEKSVKSMMDGVTQTLSANPALLEGSGMSAEEFSAAINQAKGMIGGLVPGDLVVKVYIYKGKIVKIYSDNKTNIMGVELGFSFDLQMKDDACSGDFNVLAAGQNVGVKFDIKDASTNPNGTISVYAPEVSADIKIVSNNTTAGDVQNIDSTISVTANGTEYINIKETGTVNNADKSFDITATATIPSENVSADCRIAGKLTDISKGEGFKFVIDNFDVSVAGTKVISMACEYGIDAKTVSATAHDASKQVYDITTLNEDSLRNIVNDNQDKIMKWATDVIQPIAEKFGGLDVPFGGRKEDDSKSDTSTEEATTEDTSSGNDEISDTLEAGDTKVKVKGFEGAELTYGSGSMLSYISSDYSLTLDYMLFVSTDAKSVLSNTFYVDESSEDGDVDVLDKEYTLDDGTEVVYSYTKRGSDPAYYSIKICRQIGDDVLCLSIYTTSDDYSVEELCDAISDKYVIVK